MPTSEWLDWLFFKTWWRYDPRDTPWVAIPYHAFNLFEGCAWVVFAGLVLRRCWRNQRSRLEAGYAVAFCRFGLTDFCEAYALSSWLLWAKLVNLIVLLKLRAEVIRRYYPGSRLYFAFAVAVWPSCDGMVWPALVSDAVA